MKLLRRTSIDFVYDMSDLLAGDNNFSFAIGIILTLASFILGFLLISRVREYNENNSDENFRSAKSMKRIAQWANSFEGLWILMSFIDIIHSYRFDGTRAFFLISCIISYVFSWVGLNSFSEANKKHNIELMKANKGDPSIVMSEDFGLSQSERDAVSTIVGNAGIPQSIKNPMSDEELYGPIDDPVFDDPHTMRKVCKSCGKVNKAEYNICSYCGMPLGEGISKEELDKVSKILNRDDKKDDPVSRILKGAGVMTDDGRIIKKKAKESGESKDDTDSGFKVTPTTDKSDEVNISVTALEGNYDTESGLGIYHKIEQTEAAVIAAEGNYIAASSPIKEEYESRTDNDTPLIDGAEPANNMSRGRKRIERVHCPHCNEMNNKNNTICAYCGRRIKEEQL